ncbi:MAG: lysoplasmalogenase [Alphaproteobacteria bacterium]
MKDRTVSRQAGDLLFLIGAAVALSYLAAPQVELVFPEGPAWKAAGIVALGLYAVTRRSWVASAALFASSVGDVMLELQPPNMVGGMAAFGIAHIFYIAAFAGYVRREAIRPLGIGLAALVLAVSIAMLVWFLPDMGKLTVPGLGYQLIITLMVMTAMVSQAPLMTRIGAVIFMISDSLIALGLYKGTPAPAGSVWITYAIAQILLARGFAEASRMKMLAKESAA